MKQTNGKASKKRELHRICEGYTILAVYLFGSMTNEGVALLDNKMPTNLDPLADLDDDQRTDYEERVIKFYQDWKPVYDQYTNEVLEAIRP